MRYNILTLEEKLKASKENPDGGVWNEEKQKWEGYRSGKGIKPNWNPFDPTKRATRITIKEKKFLQMLSLTGSMNEAYRAAYKVKPHPENKSLENARVQALAGQVLARLREKAPELAAAFTFDDITPEFVKKGIMDLYKRSKDKEDMHIEKGTLELMGKIHGMFTDKQIITNKITEIADVVYRETDEDMPVKDGRLSRQDIEEKFKA